MSKTPEDMIAELFLQIGALGRQIDQSDDPQAAAAHIAQSLEQLRAVIAGMDAGEDAPAIFAQVTAAIERMREALKEAGVDADALAGALTPSSEERPLSADEMAQSLDEQTGGAFSRYRAANEAKAMEAIKKNARANAEQSAKQVKPNLDFSDVAGREDNNAGNTKEDDA